MIPRRMAERKRAKDKRQKAEEGAFSFFLLLLSF
jgi:hypothetical protein